MEQKALIAYLDEYLQIQAYQDASANGLQVENSGRLTRVGLAVDAALEPILLAAEEGCDLLLVHHGLFWGAPVRLTGYLFKRVRALIRSDIALYAAHLPLDAHEEVGNNAQIARRLSLAEVSPFGRYGGMTLGAQGLLPATVPLEEALEACRLRIGPTQTLLRFGPDAVRRVGIVTGSASDPRLFEEAATAGIDLLVTGEPKQSAYALGQEYCLNVYYGGHYRTETFGLDALGAHLAERFGLPVSFLETACPL